MTDKSKKPKFVQNDTFCKKCTICIICKVLYNLYVLYKNAPVDKQERPSTLFDNSGQETLVSRPSLRLESRHWVMLRLKGRRLP